jgi:hypothetical protein
MCDPAMTTVAAPTLQMGKEAMKLLKLLISVNTPERRQVLLPVHLARRHSCGRPLGHVAGGLPTRPGFHAGADHSCMTEVCQKYIKSKLTSQEPVIEPLSLRKFCDRFMVRVPPDLHRNLVIEAVEAGVSLNRLAVDELSHSRL